jgi:MFS family permease
MAEANKPWYRELNRYHWLVLCVCTAGWLFDCLDQQLFNLARKPAVAELKELSPSDPDVDRYGGWATSLLLIGWATGGIFFGIMGDRWGRVKTMVCTILAYSLFTGLTYFAVGLWDFLLYRFLAGLGVGGQFAVGVALVAESLPNHVRPQALGALQAFSAVGNVGAGLISLWLNKLAAVGTIDSAWRLMFAIGILPALLVVIVIRHLREPEAWTKAVAERRAGTKKAGSLGELFGDPRWRKRVIVGMILASAGVIGLWAIGVFSNDLTQSVFRKRYEAEAREQGEAKADLQFVAMLVAAPQEVEAVQAKIRYTHLLGSDPKDADARSLYAAAVALHAREMPVAADAVLDLLDKAAPNGKEWKAQSADDRGRRGKLLTAAAADGGSFDEHVDRIVARTKRIGGEVGYWAAITLILFNLGAFVGMYSFSLVTARIGRRATFLLAFLAAMGSTIVAFLFMSTPRDLFWMVPLMGCCQLSVFGGYAIYFPELFPTRLRSTGTSFCYNIARYAAAAGPAVMTSMAALLFSGWEEPLRPAGVTMCACFLVGIIVLLFAPETKGKPLPE